MAPLENFFDIYMYSLKITFVCSVVVSVRFGSPNVTVPEEVGVFMMCVLKDRDTIGRVTVTLSSAPGTATEGIGKWNPQMSTCKKLLLL